MYIFSATHITKIYRVWVCVGNYLKIYIYLIIIFNFIHILLLFFILDYP